MSIKYNLYIITTSFRLIVNLNDIRTIYKNESDNLLRGPRIHMVAFQQAAQEIATEDDPTTAKLLKTNDIEIGFEGSMGANSVSPRGMLSRLLNQLVEVEGIVTRCSNVRPKLVRSVQFCEKNMNYTKREYRDATSLDIGLNVDGSGSEKRVTSSVIVDKDTDGNALEMELGLSRYKDYQTLVLQEMPERARVGQLPRSIEVIVENDLVDRAKPGDRIRCIGVYRPLPSNVNNVTSGIFRSVLILNNISVIGKEIGAVILTGEDRNNIVEMSNRKNLLDTMASSLCPSVFGHEFVKKALILQLLGGCERNLDNGTHLRGDINVLLVGDPSTAKSQMLRAILDIAPLAISTTGRGSSGVGLTAAVTSDAETGERRLEAGAMVLADRGVVCIDEFDKMSEGDRVAIHEVMEQQTVTIAKAGIHASLNARCSVLGAANPVYGQYDRTRRPQDNIGLPDSLLSRFDLLFIILDQLEPEFDRRLSEHVITSHQYRRPGTIMEPEPLNQVVSLNLDNPSERVDDAPVWLRGGSSSSSSSKSSSSPSSNTNDIFTKEFLRKYLHYAKNRIQPILSDLAMESISSHYAELRSKRTQKNLPITARTLETIIRLSSAHAKLRLSEYVENEDVEVAIELLSYVLFHEIGDTSSASKSNTVAIIEDEELSNDPSRKRSSEGVQPIQEKRSKVEVIVQIDENNEVMNIQQLEKVDRQDTRLLSVKETVDSLFDGDYIRITDILDFLNNQYKTGKFNDKELLIYLRVLEADNLVCNFLFIFISTFLIIIYFILANN